MLNHANFIAQNLIKRRREKGALAIYDIVSGWATTEEGQIVRILPEKSHLANIIIQEFMILANTAISEFVAKKEIPILYRNHTAKSIAPNRDQFLADLNNLLMNSSSINAELLQDRINLVINKATYGPYLEGHFGLNLTTYTHFTSPIRRYADLINHRIISAVIDGRKPPYSINELDEIATHINQINAQIQSEKSKHFKSKAKDKAIKAIESVNFEFYKDKDFYRVIKAFFNGNNSSYKLEKEIIKRLRINKLAVKSISLILFYKNENPSCPMIQEEALKMLSKKPAIAMQALIIGCQKNHWDLPVFNSIATGESHATLFTAIASMNINNRKYMSDECKASSKKLAEQNAALSLISKIIEIDIDDNVKTDPEDIIENIEVQNYKGQLCELVQINKWAQPVYLVKKSGLEHNPTFFCVAEIFIDEEFYKTKSIQGKNKKEAEQNAAKELLNIIPKPIKNKEWEHLSSSISNPISELNDYCYNSNIPMPIYSSEVQIGPSNITTVQVNCSIIIKDETFKTTGIGLNKKIAKQKAASMMIEHLDRIEDLLLLLTMK